MNHIDEELRKALKRVEPPDGFADRVLARVAEERARPGLLDRIRAWFATPQLRWAAAAAMCLVMVAGIAYQREMERRAEGRHAKEQVMLALKITAKQLQVAEKGIRRLNEVR